MGARTIPSPAPPCCSCGSLPFQVESSGIAARVSASDSKIIRKTSLTAFSLSPVTKRPLAKLSVGRSEVGLDTGNGYRVRHWGGGNGFIDAGLERTLEPRRIGMAGATAFNACPDGARERDGVREADASQAGRSQTEPGNEINSTAVVGLVRLCTWLSRWSTPAYSLSSTLS